MKILITGASGFLGVNLQNYLRELYQIESLRIRYAASQRIVLEGDVILHLSGKAHDLKKVSNPQEYYEANFELTKQLFDAFLLSNACVFVFMSTVKAVADSVDGILDESKVSNPKTHYGLSKQQAEAYILSQKLPQGKRVYVLRPCMIHGPGNKGNLNLLFQLVSKGLPWPLGGFHNQRSFLSVENLCFAIQELVENEAIPSGIYNIADDIALSTNELMHLLGESLGKPTKIWSLPQYMIRSLAKVGDVIPSPLNTERLQKLTESYVVDNSKIKKAIGKEFPLDSREGLQITFQSFKK